MIRQTLSVLTLLMTLAPGAWALESAPFTTKRDTVALVSEADDFAPGKPLRLGLHIQLAPGWHTYWSNPGDAGAPPSLAITGAPAGPIVYPAPERLTDGPFTSFAYTGDVLLPVTITPEDPRAGMKLTISADATWLVCAEVCVPEQAHFQLILPRGTGQAGAQAPLFATADAKTPRASPFPAHIAKDGTLWLEAPNLAAKTAFFYPDVPGVFDHGATQTLATAPNRFTLHLKPLKAFDPQAKLGGVLAITDQAGGVENLHIDATPAPLPAGGAAAPGLLRALLLAFAGGLILNLMPCVLPVLAIKALALARLSGAARRHVRAEAGFYVLGVLAAFAVIGVVILGARAAGGAAGWGAQFQSAWFTAAMAWLLFAIGLNLSGVFEIGAGLAGTGESLAARGSFFTGLLAVVVATPCTAPFMGAALAAALALPPAAAMLIFLALGLGLAAPYALLAIAPGFARVLPKPGAWMEVFKNLLAFPMYGAALWLVWVAAQQTGPNGLLAALGGFLLVGFAAWAFGRAQTQDRPRLLQAGSLAAVTAMAAILASLAAAPQAASALTVSDGAEPFSEARLEALRAEHRPILVDMSAAWCVTCLVNERVALSPQPVRDAFTRAHVAYLKGDWTNGDPAITAYLKKFDRSGVPLYVFYPQDGDPEVLPQILTQTEILRHIGAS